MLLLEENFYWCAMVQVKMGYKKLHFGWWLLCLPVLIHAFTRSEFDLLDMLQWEGVSNRNWKTGSRYIQRNSFSKSHWTLSWQRDSINAPHESTNEMPGKAKKGKEKNRNHSCNISLNNRARNQRVIKDEQEVRNNTIWRQKEGDECFPKSGAKKNKKCSGSYERFT